MTIGRVLHRDNESTILVTAQNNQGITVDAVEIPVVQFIGGGFDRCSAIGEQVYSYQIDYVSNQNVYVIKSDNISQMRVWAR